MSENHFRLHFRPFQIDTQLFFCIFLTKWPPARCYLHTWMGGLKVALLMPDRIREVRERWKDLVDELSAYYNTPGRLAVIRRQFENARRHPGLDPATFATELGISGITRILMVRNKFIAAQQSCDLRRHLDGAAPGGLNWEHCRQLPHLGEVMRSR